jgi:ParB family chromosome partitioning protein
MSKLIELPTSTIIPQQLDRDVTEQGIDELVNSIRQHGIIEPLIVSESNGEYHLIAGKRRLVSAKRLNLPTVPCLLIETSHDHALALTLHENLYREELNPVHESAFYIYMRDQLNMSNRQIAQLTGKKEAYISQRMQIQQWQPNLVKALRDAKISFSVARELSRVTNTKDLYYLLHHAVTDGANYRTVNLWVRNLAQTESAPSSVTPSAPEVHTPKQQFRTKALCVWCDAEVDIDEIMQVLLCPECYRSLMSAKNDQKQKP